VIPVSQTDVENRLQRDLSTDEVGYLPGTADEASALVEGYLGVCYADGADVPDAVTVVTSRVVARLLTSNSIPSQVESASRSMGPFSAQLSFVADSTSGGPWLTKSDKMTLAPYRARGAVSIPLVRESASVTTVESGS
jgi:hypothetical protein